METQSIPGLNPTFRLQWEDVQDCYVLLYPEGMVKLSQTAGEILKRVDGQTSVAGIIEQLQGIFQTQDDLSADVLTFLHQACENGWLSDTR